MIRRQDLMGSTSLYAPRWEPEGLLTGTTAANTWTTKTADEIVADINRAIDQLHRTPAFQQRLDRELWRQGLRHDALPRMICPA